MSPINDAEEYALKLRDALANICDSMKNGEVCSHEAATLILRELADCVEEDRPLTHLQPEILGKVLGSILAERFTPRGFQSFLVGFMKETWK